MSDAINYLPTTATSHNNNFSLFTTKLSSSDDGSIFHKIVQEDKDTGGEEYERQDRMTSNCSFLGTTFSFVFPFFLSTKQYISNKYVI